MRRYALRDDQWDRIKDFLPGREGHVGGTAADNRLFVDAVLYRYRAGIPWRDLPERFEDWKIVYQRFNRWAKSGVFERIFKLLASDHDPPQRPVHHKCVDVPVNWYRNPMAFTIARHLPCGTGGNAPKFIWLAGVFHTVSSIATLSAQKAAEGLPRVSGSSDINGSVIDDTVVQRNCSLHIRGNLLANLTIESGAKVVVEGSVDGKIINRGGRLVVNNKPHASCITTDGPAEAEACGVLKIDLTAVVSNWEKLAKYGAAECAAVVKGNAYGCGIEPIAGALAKNGCSTFFVSDIPEARRVRAVAPGATIYVLRGLCTGTGLAYAEINARPVIYSSVEIAEWDRFVSSSQWAGGCALHVDTGEGRLGLSIEEAAALAPCSRRHGITLLMSRLDNPDKPAHPPNDHQISQFCDLHRLYRGIPASLANSSGIFFGQKAHFDLVRAGAALYGINPTPRADNPMLPVIELRARIVHVLNLAPGETIADTDWAATRRTRLALVSAGYADGYPRPASAFDNKLQAIVGGQRCPVAGHPSMDLLAIDVTNVSDLSVVRRGKMVTLIGPEISIDDLAAASKSTGREVLSHLGRRFHRIYHVT